MNFFALALDYDGTLAHDSKVEKSTVDALEKARESGRRLVLVTGRQLEDLLAVFERQDLFEWMVAENGGVLYCPRTRESRLLTEPVPLGFADALGERGVREIGVGKTIIATWRPHECTVLETLRDLGLDRQITFNKNAVMVLPSGVNKGTGLTAALEEMKLSPHNVVAAGDAENDLPMLTQCECGVAVRNALDSVKAKADFVTAADHGAGVEELIADLLRDDLADRLSALPEDGILLGTANDKSKRKVFLPSLGQSVLIAGPSGSGKSIVLTGLLERLANARYQFCLFDPEGDYEDFQPAINLGNPHHIPSGNEVLALLDRMHSVVVNLLGVSLDTRPAYVSEVLRKLQDLRTGSGRPHWIIVDEAHHIFPSEWPRESTVLPKPPKPSLMITVHPDHISREALASADIVIAVGKDPHQTIREFCRSASVNEPRLEPLSLGHWEILAWFRKQGDPIVITIEPGKTEHKRHIRKYADGDLRDRSFVFRGADGKLNLAAQNFNTFIRIASGVDDDTWLHHLRSNDYSRWIREVAKDDSLAERIEEIEQMSASAQETREKVFEAIRAKYTAPE
jgi:hydroxymethylpyrimidine pyrophosphatase-like HAD family hydrolase